MVSSTLELSFGWGVSVDLVDWRLAMEDVDHSASDICVSTRDRLFSTKFTSVHLAQ
jgi:hypothetical protein